MPTGISLPPQAPWPKLTPCPIVDTAVSKLHLAGPQKWGPAFLSQVGQNSCRSSTWDCGGFLPHVAHILYHFKKGVSAHGKTQAGNDYSLLVYARRRKRTRYYSQFFSRFFIQKSRESHVFLTKSVGYGIIYPMNGRLFREDYYVLGNKQSNGLSCGTIHSTIEGG